MKKSFFIFKLFLCCLFFIISIFFCATVFAQKNTQVLVKKLAPCAYYPKIVNKDVSILKVDKSERQIIVKLKPSETIDTLTPLNQKYDVVSVEKVFKDVLSPEAVLAKLKKDFSEVGKKHDTWFWQLDKNSKEYKEYEEKLKQQKDELANRIQNQEKLIVKLEERQKRVVQKKDPPDLSSIYLVETKNSSNIKAMVSDYSQHSAVAYAEPNLKIKINAFPDSLPNDTYVDSDQNGTWSTGAFTGIGMNYDDLWGTNKIEAEKAWKISQGDGILVAVIDTGVDYNHEDISTNIWTNSEEVAGNGIDDDFNGYIDDVRGWDFANSDNAPMDDVGHGTHCAGTIAAIGNNGKGIIGVAPKAKIMPIKTMGLDGTADYATLVSGIYYAINNGADVLSNSWGGEDSGGLTLQQAFNFAESKGCVSVVSAGNGDNNGVPQDASGWVPAKFSNVITVGAYGPDLLATSFSNYGSVVTVAAPGFDILSLRAQGTDMYGKTNPGYFVVGTNYYRSFGTSMSCPHVSGVVALIMSKYKNFTAQAIKNVLTQTVDVPGVDVPVQPRYIGKGFVNAFKALQVTDVSDAIVSFKDLSSIVSGKIDIKAEIVDTNFSSYTLYYGVGNAPSQWIQLSSSTSLPVSSGGIICTDFDTTILEDGVATLKIKEIDSNGLIKEVLATVEVKNTVIYLSEKNNFYRKGDSVNVKGKLSGISFKLEYGIGDGIDQNVTSWLSDGVGLTNNGNLPITGDVIATLNTSQLPADKYFCLKLTLTYTSGNKKEFIFKNNFIDSALKENFPKIIDSDISGLTIGDVTNDLGKELLLMHIKSFDVSGKVFSLLNQTGNLIWSKSQSDGDAFKAGYMGTNFSVPTVADLNNDGNKEIAFNTSDRSGTVCLLDKSGNMLTNWPKGCAFKTGDTGKLNGIYSSPVFEDIDKDNQLECIVSGLMYDIRNNSSDKLRLLNAWKINGDYVQGWPNNSKDEYASDATPAVGDLDKDGRKEIVFVEKNNTGTDVIVLDADGNIKSGWPVNLQISNQTSSPVLGDINNDGNLEIILTEGYTVSGQENNKKINIWKKDGSYLSGWPKQFNFNMGHSPALADFNNDKKLEIVIVNNLGDVYVFDYAGNIVTGWPKALSSDTEEKASGFGISCYDPVIVDVDGDNQLEIVAVVYKNPQKFGYLAELHALKFDGSEVAGWPKPMISDNPLAWGGNISVDDIDGDSLLEIVTYINKNLYIWDTNSTYDLQKMAWPQFQHDALHTGNYHYGKVTEQDPTKPSTPVVSDDGATTKNKTQLFSSWVCEDTNNIVDIYEYKILEGSVSGNVVRDWTSNDKLKNVTAGGLNLEEGKTYYFAVRAKSSSAVYSDIGYSDGIQVVAETDPNKPSMPVVSDEGVTTKDKSQLLVSWVCDDPNGIIADYEYQLLEGSTSGNIIKNWMSAGNQKAIIVGYLNLEEGKTYYFAVRAKSNAAVYSDIGYSDGIQVVTESSLAAPTNLSYVVHTTVSVDLTWTDKSDNENGFKVEKSTDNINFLLLADVASNVTNYTDNSIVAGNTYYYRVYAYDGSQNSAYSNIVTVKINSSDKDVTPPVGTITVNKDNAYTNWNKVLVEFSAQDSESGMGKGAKMKIAVDNEDGSTTGKIIESEYSTKKIFLLDEEGKSIFTVIYCDVAGNWSVTPVTGFVTYDSHPPEISLRINNGAVSTNTNSVLLNTMATDSLSGVGNGAKMRFKNDGASWTQMEAFAITKNWTLSDGLGKKTVFVQVSDAAGNWSEPVSASIDLQQQTAKPVANEQTVHVIQNKVVDIVLTAKSSVDSFSIVADPIHGFLSGSAPNMKYTPQNDYVGQDSFTFKVVKDSLESDSALVTINISQTNNAPVLKKIYNRNVAVGVKVKFFIKATDVDNDKVTYEANNLPATATFDKKLGYFEWTPAVEGNYDITFAAIDEKEAKSDSQTIKITVSK